MTINTELKQRCRRRQQEQQKSNSLRLAKQQLHHAFLSTSLPSLHDHNVKVPNSRSAEDVNTIKRLSFSFPELLKQSVEFTSRKICQHLTNRTRWNKPEKVCSSANSLFKWRFRSRRRRFCLSSLIILQKLLYTQLYLDCSFHIEV